MFFVCLCVSVCGVICLYLWVWRVVVVVVAWGCWCVYCWVHYKYIMFLTCKLVIYSILINTLRLHLWINNIFNIQIVEALTRKRVKYCAWNVWWQRCDYRESFLDQFPHLTRPCVHHPRVNGDGTRDRFLTVCSIPGVFTELLWVR